MTLNRTEPSGFRWLYSCQPCSSSSSITVVRSVPLPHKLNVAVSAELLSLVSDSFLALPARTAPVERTSASMCSPALSI
ncbi:hypothetical protein G0R83_003480 [Salmonella enterica]|nr:hypothetical protein [Salmonella enterica]EEI4533565.1 hypothetical protein [Salmonella enterica]